MADTVTLKFAGESFSLSKSKLVEHSDYFKAYFERWDDRTKGRWEFAFDDKSSDAFRIIYNYIVLDADFSFRDIDLSNLDDSLELAAFLVFHRYERRVRQLLTDCWNEADDAVEVLRYARTKYPDEPRLVSRCLWQVADVLHDLTDQLYPPEKSYALVDYSATELKQLYMYCRDPYDTSKRIKDVLLWLVAHPFTRKQINHLLNHSDMEIFPVRFVREYLESAKDLAKEEVGEHSTSLKLVSEGVETFYSGLKRELNKVLSGLYVFDNTFLRKFDTLLWTWQKDRVLENTPRLFAAHMIGQTVYLFFNYSFCLLDLNSMSVQETRFSRADELGQYRQMMWLNCTEIMTCHDDRRVYVIPNWTTDTFSGSCGLQFDLLEREFSKLTLGFDADVRVRARPVCHGGFLYLAGIDNKYKCVKVYRYDATTQTHTRLCKKNVEGIKAPYKLVNLRLCLGVLDDQLYVFCFGYDVYFSVTLNGPYEESDLVGLENEHLKKMIVQKTPHVSVFRDSFVILLQTLDQELELEYLVVTVKPKTNVLKILGFIPGTVSGHTEIISLVTA